MILGQRQILNSLNTRRSDTHTWDRTHLSAVPRTPVIPIRSDFAPLFARDEIFSFPPSSPFRSNGREIDLTTGNRMYKSFPQRVILL